MNLRAASGDLSAASALAGEITEITMLRKTIIALAAAAAVVTTMAAPTAAEAGWRHRYWYRHGWVAPAIVAGAIVTGAVIAAGPRCYRRVWVATPYGPRKVRAYVC
jgi:hypothetical protein